MNPTGGPSWAHDDLSLRKFWVVCHVREFRCNGKTARPLSAPLGVHLYADGIMGQRYVGELDLYKANLIRPPT